MTHSNAPLIRDGRGPSGDHSRAPLGVPIRHTISVPDYCLSG